MASQSQDYKLVCDGHKCEICDKLSETLNQLRAGAESQCPLSLVRLACVEWALARLVPDATRCDIQYNGPFQLIVFGESVALYVELFDLCGT